MNFELNRPLMAVVLLLFGCTSNRTTPLLAPVQQEPIKAPLSTDDTRSDWSLQAASFVRPKAIAAQQWLVLGPFENEVLPGATSRAGLDRDYLKELGGESAARVMASTELEQGKIKARVARPNARGIVDMAALFAGASDFKVGYAYAEIPSERPLKVRAHFGSDDSAMVWVNGVRVHRVVQQRAIQPDDDRFELSLAPGTNRVLVKVENGQGGWGFALRLYDGEAQQKLEALELRRHLEWFELAPEEGQYLLRDSFPALSWNRPGGARTVFGGKAPRVRWFGPNLEELRQPAEDGRYVALVEAETLDGHTYRRMVSFAKVADQTLPWFPAPPGSEPEQPIALPANAKLNEAQRLEVSRHVLAWGNRGIWQGEGAAILAASLHELARAPKSDEPRWLQSSFIANEEHQLALRLKLEGRAKRPLPKPERLTSPAPRLRPGSEAEAGMKPGTVARLRKLAKAWGQADPSEFVVLVARRGVIFMHEGFNGFGKDSTFYPASIGKTIAGLLFARAVDAGLVKFDTPLSSVFPEFGTSKAKLPERASQLTFRHCFYHVAGMTNHRSHGGLYNVYLDNALLISDIALGAPLESFVYNGDDLNLTGKALELTTGQSIFRLLYEQLQQPFGEAVIQLDLGAGDRFNALYLAKLGQLLLQDGAYGDYRLFSPGLLEQLWPRRIAEFVPGFEDPKLEAGIGLSWMIDPTGPREQGALGPNVVGHGAASGVTWRMAPDHDLVIVVGRNKFADWQNNEAWAAKFVAEVAAGLGTPPTRAKLARP